ncbi:hypothetical protein GQ42DRAFT_154646 [Ramicandelaber brevisporus]|nr:hypothetical protein GQ42DRAFT_154646 [Ramicandelaber brevisporus]
MSSYYNNGGSGGTPYGQPPPPQQQQHNFGYSHLSQPTYAQQLHQQQQPPAYYGQTQQQPPQQQQYGGYFPPPPQPQSQPGYAHGDAGGLPPDYAHMSPVPPYYGDKGGSQYTGKPVFRDLWAAILYFAHLAGFVVLAVVILKNMPKETLRFSGDFSNAKEFWSWPTIVILIAAAGIGFALSFVYLLCMHLFTTALIIVSFFMTAAGLALPPASKKLKGRKGPGGTNPDDPDDIPFEMRPTAGFHDTTDELEKRRPEGIEFAGRTLQDIHETRFDMSADELARKRQKDSDSRTGLHKGIMLKSKFTLCRLAPLKAIA